MVNVFFRTEEHHCSSSEHNVVIPVPCGDSEVDHPVVFQNNPPLHPERHAGAAATTGCQHIAIAMQSSEDAQRVPDAVAPPGALANLCGECRRYGGEWRGTPEFTIF